MRFCLPHWDKLRAEVDKQGLGAYVSDSPSRATEQLQRKVDGEDSLDTFDPLMRAHMAIIAAAISIVGVTLFLDDDDGTERCPICYMQRLHDESCTNAGCDCSFEDSWITGAVADEVAHLTVLTGNGRTDGGPDPRAP